MPSLKTRIGSDDFYHFFNNHSFLIASHCFSAP